MKSVRKYSYVILLLLFVLAGCGRKDEKDAERLSQLNSQVESLYNEEMDDLADYTSAKEFEEAKASVSAETESELSEENEAYFKEIEALYQNAIVMNELEADINDLFNEEIVKEETEMQSIDALSESLDAIDSETWSSYVPRQREQLVEAKEQLEQIQLAEELVTDLYRADDEVNPEATREEEEAAKEAVGKVKNQEVKARLEERLKTVDERFTEWEEEAKKANEGVGYFEGMYLSDENIILYLDEELYFLAENVASDNLVHYEVTEILENTGEKLRLALHQEPIELLGVEGGDFEETFYLSDDHQRITNEEGVSYERLTEEEMNEIYERLPGLKDPGDWQE